MKFNNYWKIPQNTKNFFSPKQEKLLKQKYGGWYTVHTILSIVIFFIPMIVFFSLIPSSGFNPTTQGGNLLGAIAAIIGFIGAGSVGVGFVNIFMALVKQYLGHYVTLISIIGGIMVDAIAMLLFYLVKCKRSIKECL